MSMDSKEMQATTFEDKKKMHKLLNGRDAKKTLPSKVFQARASLLTELLSQDPNLKIVHNLILIFITRTVLFTAFANYNKEQRFYLGSNIIQDAFKNIDKAFIIWLCFFLASLVVFWCFILWANERRRLAKTKQLWDGSWLFIYVLYVFSTLYSANKCVTRYDLGVASSVALMLETFRFLMQSHAFIRSNAPKYLQNGGSHLPPKFCHYLYFSFAPTIVYKDAYPKSNSPIRWGYVIRCFLEMILSILYFSISLDNAYSKYLTRGPPNTLMDLLAIQIETVHIGILFILIFFYAGFECYLNAMAEMLRFSDRQFYTDWWTTVNPSKFLKKWNIFVYDWLYTYIYKDLYENVFPGNKQLGRIVVYLLSGIVHDFIVGTSGRAFIPLMIIYFCCILAVTQFQFGDMSNILLWVIIGLMISGEFTIYMAEYNAILNCPTKTSTIFDFFKPKLLNC